MRVLIACEFSGVVREAFAALGHDAWSCDLLPSNIDGQHIEGDVREVLHLGWDLMIAFPPCTYLCSSGLHWNKRRPEREALTSEAVEFVRTLMNAPIPRIAIENPVGRISTAIRKPDQMIHPWQFGHPESKGTCLWLKGLPELQPTNVVQAPPAWVECPDGCDDYVCALHLMHVADCKCPPIDVWAARGISPYETGGRWANQTPSGQNKLGPSPDRWKLRSITYQGTARAMAEQWGR